MILVIVLAAIFREQAPPGDPAYGVTWPILRITIANQSVQRELKLHEQQVKACKNTDEIFNRMAKATFPTFEKLDPDEKDRKTLEYDRMLLMGMNRVIAEILTPEQSRRLGQIILQGQGHGAFVLPPLQNVLGLGDDQRKKMAEIDEEWKKSRNAVWGGNRDRADLTRRLRALKRTTDAKVFRELTPDQKAKWDAMTGPPFEMTPNSPGALPNSTRQQDSA